MVKDQNDKREETRYHKYIVNYTNTLINLLLNYIRKVLYRLVCHKHKKVGGIV